MKYVYVTRVLHDAGISRSVLCIIGIRTMVNYQLAL